MTRNPASRRPKGVKVVSGSDHGEPDLGQDVPLRGSADVPIWGGIRYERFSPRSSGYASSESFSQAMFI